MSRPGIEPGLPRWEARKLFEHLVNGFSEHLQELATASLRLNDTYRPCRKPPIALLFRPLAFTFTYFY